MALLIPLGQKTLECFFQCREKAGSTKVYDLLKRDLTFSVNRATLGASGGFGSSALFDGTDDILIQDPMAKGSAIISSGYLYMKNTGSVIVQKLKPIGRHCILF